MYSALGFRVFRGSGGNACSGGTPTLIQVMARGRQLEELGVHNLDG